MLSTTTTGSDTTDTGDTTSTTDLSGKIRLRSTVSIASGKPSSEIANATVYAIGQESSKTTTNSNGEFTLLVDTKQSGTVLQKSRALPRRDSTPPARNQYGIIVASNTREHGKKFEITGNDGDDITLPSPVEITEVGSISGKVTLQNQTDNTGIMVYIPGTSFMALTDASGSFTISSIPEGTYLILRAEKDGYNYSALSNITVQSSKTTTVSNQMLLISTGAKGSILINNGASITTSRTVDVNISATDNAVLMTIAEEPTFQNVSWITFQSYITYSFTSDGDKTLYIKFADANGLESTTYSDSITIDTNPRVTLSSPSGTISLTKPSLSWTASTLPNPKYHVQVSTSSTFSSILEEATNLTSTSYSLTNTLSNATTYYWRVSIIDENGREWNWSDTGTFTIDLSTVTLITPSNSSITSDTTPTFSWSENSNAVSYNLFLSTNSNLPSEPTKTGIAETSFTDSDINALTNTAGTIYYWAVTPVDTNSASGTRSNIYSFTLDTTAPTGSILINNGDTSTPVETVTLTIAATDTIGVTGYYTSENSTAPSVSASGWTSVTSTTSYTGSASFPVSSGSGNKTIYIWFRDSAGNMSSSVNDSIGLAPSAPTGISATADNTQTTITWSAVTDATSYNIYWLTSKGVTKTTGTKIINATSPYTHTGITNGTTYYYVITAVNSYGESSESSEVGAMPWKVLKLPDTGQTGDYTTTFGEDSDYTNNPPSYTDNGNGTITDNVTGFMWQKEDDNTTRTWIDAGTYCDNLTLGGYTDWRLPSKKELISIVNYGTYLPSINSTYFPNTKNGYLSSTTDASSSSLAWMVDFSRGQGYDIQRTNGFYVRCVRGDSLTTRNFTDNGNETITDNDRGLMWQKEDDNTKRTWESAITYCEGLSLGGYNDWRLPNIKELESITDDTKDNPSIDQTYFPNTNVACYWSSTTVSDNSLYYAFQVGFLDNSVNYNQYLKSDDSVYVRCVRGGQ